MKAKIISFLLILVIIAGAILLYPFRGLVPAVIQSSDSPFVLVATTQPTPTMNITSIQVAPAVIKSMKELGRLETLTMTVQQPVRLMRSDVLMLGLKDAEQVELLATADVIAGVDLDLVSESNIHSSAEGVSIVLPAATIFNIVPDESSLLPVSHTVSLFGKQRDSFVHKAREIALDAIRKTAIEKDICASANEKAQKKIRIFIERLGVRVIDVSSTDGDCS